LGVSYYRGKGYNISIDQNKLTFFNTVTTERLFLDPQKYGGRNRGLSKKDQLSPLTINSIDNRWLVDSFNAKERAGMIIKTQENQKMTPYQSSYEIINKNYYGLSRQNDQIDFWTNSNPAVWNDSKNYPLTLRKEIEAKTYELRKQGLLVNKGKMVQWKTDFYGNEYGLFKGKSTQSLLPTDYILGKNSTYVGFTAGTGALNNEHWIHDFSWTSGLENINYSTFLNNLNYLNFATRINNSVRLTQAINGQTGQVFYKTPLFIIDSNDNFIDWSLYFVFSMGGGTRADGLYCTLQSNILDVGGGGSGMGYDGIPNSVGIGYDTFNNGGNDPNNNHMELSVNGNTTNPLIVIPELGLNLCGSSGTNAYRYNWIEYKGNTKQLDVYISNTSTKPTTPILSTPINIEDYVIFS
jgi:hypothetical protein